MSGIDNLTGIDFQISYGVYRILDLISGRIPFKAIQFEEIKDEGQDLSVIFDSENVELVQVKKRGESYLWTPSSLRPILEKLFQNKNGISKYVFFSDGSLNSHLANIREAITKNNLDDLSDSDIDNISPDDVPIQKFRELLNKLSLQTRQFVSNDPSRPGSALRSECLRLLTEAPFTPLLDMEQIYERLWNLVFDTSKEAKSLSAQDISNLIETQGLIQRYPGLPIALENAIDRKSFTDSIGSSLDDNSVLFAYGISGTGKSTLVSQFATTNTARRSFWITASQSTTGTTIRQALALSLEERGVSTYSGILRNRKTSDIEALRPVIAHEKILMVFDNIDRLNPSTVDLFRELIDDPSNKKNAKIIFISQAIPTWYHESAIKNRNVTSIHIKGLSYEEFTNYISLHVSNVSEDNLRWFFEETGGIPIAASLLKSSIQKSQKDDLGDIFKQDAKSIHKFLFSKVFSNLQEKEKEFVEAASIFDYVFTIEEVNMILDQPLKSISKIRALSSTGIVTELSNGIQIHDSIRPLAYGMLLPGAATDYHRKMATYYKQQMESRGRLFELIHKWGSHLDKTEDLKSPYMKEINSISPDYLFCLWSIYYSGFPYCFSQESLENEFKTVTELMQKRFVKFEINYDSERRVFDLDRAPTLLTLTTEDDWDQSFVWYLAQRDTPANHMGYIDVTRPNFAWMLQRHTMCPWEHCIEYEPLVPHDQEVSAVKTWFEEALAEGEFAWRGKVTNTSTLAQLNELIELGDSTPDDHRFYDILGSCPTFGHCCPGGPEQARACKRNDDRYLEHSGKQEKSE
ncbi:MAG TPA: ATP-binding protein [Mesorhizobium sp.]|uniref:ATP-binding protein n=1 Tax=Mesorhizobium sp. TaxID=1871066 RepID=UPI002DDD2CC3|nr:ATP-binding protein [Mesorhizobium sp.]HEV2502957.1 ATP-binding protein [Mesorhizobium sp.]